MKFPVRTKAGLLRYWSFNASAPGKLKDGRRFVVGMALDITERKAAEAVLRESEQRMQMALRLSRSFAFEWDTATDRVLRSDSCADMLGLTGEDVKHDTGQRYFQRVHPDDRDRFVRMLGELKPTADTYHTEYRVLRGDGTTVLLEESAQAFFDAEGKLRRLIGVALDITERRAAEEQIRKASTRFEILSQTSSTLLESKNPQQIVDSLCSRMMNLLDCHIFVNYLVDETAGRLHLNASGGLPEKMVRDIEWLDFGQAVCGRVAQEGKRIIAEDIQQSCDPRADLVRSVGICAYACHPIMIHGKVIGTLSFGTRSRKTYSDDDLSTMKTVTDQVATAMERMLAEDLLRQSQEDLSQAQEVGGIGSWRLDVRKNQLTWSDENHRIFGIPKGTPMTYETFLSVVHPDDRAYVDARWKAGLAGEDYDIEHRLVVDGRVKWVREKAYLEFDSKRELVGGFGITQDITERKHVEYERETTVEFLTLVNNSATIDELICSATAFFQKQSGCQAVGIRLKNGDDYPYYETRGFDKEFVRAENSLCAKDLNGQLVRDDIGNPVIECMCGNVVCGRFDPDKPFFTEHGSFWTNCTTDLLASTTEADRQSRTRNRCNGAGYESVALVPLSAGEQRLGLLQLNDRRKGQFSPARMGLWERLADYLAGALAKLKAEEALRQAHDELEQRVIERTAQLNQTVQTLETEVEQRIAAEQAIKAERKRFEDVLEMMPAYAILLRPDYHVAYANRTFREWFGDDNGKKCYEFLFNRTEPCEGCETYTVLKTGKSHFWEWTGPNGHNYDIYDYPFTDSDGSPLIMEIGVDVTAHKQAQKAVETGERRYRSLTVATTQIVWTTDVQGQVVGDMPSWRNFTGQSVEDIQGWGWINSLHPDDRQRTSEIWTQSVQNKTLYQTEYRIRRHDGRYQDMSVCGVPVLESDGSIREWVGTCTDITERKQAQERIRFTNVLLELFTKKASRKEYLDAVVSQIQAWSGCQCVGVRLAEGDGWLPYASCVGFSDEFLAEENMLSLKNDNCLCIRAITQTQEFSDSPLLTPRGSFCSCDTFSFLDTLSGEEKSRYRGTCMRHGFASLAVIPVRYRDQIVGAVHLADQHSGRAPAEMVGFLEHTAMLIGEAVHRFDIEAKLRQSEEQYRLLVELSPDGIGIEQDGKIAFVNTMAVNLLGCRSAEELIGRDILDVVHPDFQKRVRKQLAYLRRKRIPLMVRQEKFLRADGTVMDVEVAASPLNYQQTASAQIVFRDITERRRQEEALQTSQGRLLEAQRIAHLGNWEWNIATGQLWWSDEVYRIFGLAPRQSEATYEAFLSYVHPDDRKQVEDAVAVTLSGLKEYVIDHRIIRPDGVERIVNERAEIVCDTQRKPVKMIGTVHDVTERRKAEQAIRENQLALRNLAAQLQLAEERERRRIAQDLHDSVGQLLAFSAMELSNIRKASPQPLVQSLKTVCGHLDEAVRQTRSLSFDLSPNILYDLGFEVAVEDLVERFGKERKIQCHFENCGLSKPLGEDVKVLLYRSVRELLINAAKHARPGSIRVSLLRTSSDVYVIVEDDGCGFDVSAMENNLRKAGGFGLFSIRERLNHIGGTLKIESVEGKGTKAVLIAPLDVEKEEKEKNEH